MIRPRLLLVTAICFCLIWAAAFFVHEVKTPRLVDRQGEVIGRDFIAFFTGGTMIRRGQGAELYDPSAQLRIAEAIVAPDKPPGLCYFVNPPHVAIAYAPLSWLPYRLAFYFHVVLMLGCFWLGVRALRPGLTTLKQPVLWPAVVLLSLSWSPMAQTIIGGQNAALTFALLSAAYAALASGKQARAGCFLGLQLFKPQYAFPLIGLVLLQRCWTTAGVATAIAIGAYLAGAGFCGFRWPQTMARVMSDYYAGAERLANGPKHVTLVEVVDYSLVMPLEGKGLVSLASALRTASYVLIVLIAGWLVWRWRQANSNRNRKNFGLYWALAVATSMVIALHANDYDVGILALPLLLLVDHRMTSGRPASLGEKVLLPLAYFALPLVKVFHLAPRLRFQPYSLVPVGTALWAAMEIRKRQCSTDRG